MRALVEDVERYPEFLPGCKSALVERFLDGRIHARLEVGFAGIERSFTTENTPTPKGLAIKLVEGPLRRLEGEWVLRPLGEEESHAELFLDYEFSGWKSRAIAAPLIRPAVEQITEAFLKRAQELYGKRESSL